MDIKIFNYAEGTYRIRLSNKLNIRISNISINNISKYVTDYIVDNQKVILWDKELPKEQDGIYYIVPRRIFDNSSRKDLLCNNLTIKNESNIPYFVSEVRTSIQERQRIEKEKQGAARLRFIKKCADELLKQSKEKITNRKLESILEETTVSISDWEDTKNQIFNILNGNTSNLLNL